MKNAFPLDFLSPDEAPLSATVAVAFNTYGPTWPESTKTSMLQLLIGDPRKFYEMFPLVLTRPLR